MLQAFDPYRKWLGIPPAEQPADHYRLLGVGRFEDDLDTISNAADRQMAHVRTFQTGPNSALSQKLLNEIAAARLCLLDRTKKAAYDRDLRAKQGPAASSQLASAQPASAQPAAQTFALPIPAPNQPVLASLRPRGPARKKSGPMIPILAGSLLLIAIIVAVVVLRGGGEEPESTQLTGQLQPRPAPSDPATRPDAAATNDDTSGSIKPSPNQPRHPEAVALPKLPPANLEIVEARWGEGEHWQDITARIRSLVHDQRLVATAAGSLFKDIADPAVGTDKRVRIRYRTAGEPAVADFANGALIYLDGHPHGAGTPSSGGLQVLEARYGSGATWIDVLPRVSRWIHGDRLAMRVEFVAQSDPAYQQRKTLFLRYRTGDGEYVAFASDGDEVALDARSAVAGKAVDLIKAVDPLRDSTGGLWRRDGMALVGPERESGNLTVRAALPKEYLLRLALDAAPRPNDVGITLPIGDGQVQLVLDGWWSGLSGLQNIDGLGLDRNASQRRGTMFVPGQANLVECVVRESSIYVTCNGRVAADWRGDPGRLSPPAEAQASGKPAIVLRGLGTPWRVSRLDAAPLRKVVSVDAETAPGKTVDLLKLVDLKLDSVAGKWDLTERGLVSAPGEGLRLQIPYSPPDDYELRLVAAPRSGDNALLIGLIVDGRQTAVIIDGWGGAISGLHFLDGQTAEVNATRHDGRVFVDEQPREVVCTVHPGSVRVTCENRTLVDWHGDARRLSMEQRYAVPDELGLWLADWNTTYLISRFELRALPPEPAAAPVALTKPVDLLGLIDPARDAVRGEWRREGKALLAPATQWARLQIPVLPPEEYTLTIEAVGNREIDFGVVVGGHQAEVFLDGGERYEQCGMQNIGGKSADHNSTIHQGEVLHDTDSNTIVCTVRKASVEVVCNGERVIQWSGDARSLSLPWGSLMPDERRLFLRCWDAPYRVTRLELSAPGATAPLGTAPALEQK